MQPPVALSRAVGEIGADRADRRAKAHPGAIAGGDVGADAAVPGIAGVEEGGDAPVVAHPVRELDRPDDQAPAADDGAGLGHADTLEGVAAHRLVAARAEEEGARNALARRRAHRARLAAKQEIVGAPERQEERSVGDGAQERLRGERVRRAAHLAGNEVALARRDQRVGAAERLARAEVHGVARIGNDARDVPVLGMRRDDIGRGRGARPVVVRYADRQLARALVLDVLLARPGEDIVPDAARSRRGIEVELQVLDLLVEVQDRAEAPGAGKHVLVGIAGLEARADVGVVADAPLDVVLGRLDHRDAKRCRLRHRRLLIDLGLYAREVAGFEQPTLIKHHLVPVVDVPGTQRREVLDHLVRIALRATDVQLAEAKGRPARDLERQVRARRRRVDARLARGDRSGGVAPGGDLAYRLALGRLPLRLAKGLAGAQAPALARALNVRSCFAVVRRRAADADIDVGDARALAGLNL